jgi:hypothetical protein
VFASGHRSLGDVARRQARGDLLGALVAYRRAAKLAGRRDDEQFHGILLGEVADLYKKEGAPRLAQPLHAAAVAPFSSRGSFARSRESQRGGIVDD